MTGWPSQPVIYEINTAVWLMGVWERSLAGQSADILSQDVFDWDGAELAGPGLFVALGPWQFHLLQ